MSAARTLVAIHILLLVTLGCAGTRPEHVGRAGASLAACPDSPNCVSSDATTGEHRIDPLRFEGDAVAAWRRARAVVEAQPRTVIVSESDTYLHAEATSALMRYRDDLELQLRADRQEIAVRSASRVGYGDMGVNRARVEALRAAFASAPR